MKFSRVIVSWIACMTVLSCSETTEYLFPEEEGQKIGAADGTSSSGPYVVSRANCDSFAMEMDACMQGKSPSRCIPAEGTEYRGLSVGCCNEFEDLGYCGEMDLPAVWPSNDECAEFDENLSNCASRAGNLGACLPRPGAALADLAAGCCETSGRGYCPLLQSRGLKKDDCKDLARDIDYCLNDGLELVECLTAGDQDISFRAHGCCDYGFSYCRALGPNTFNCQVLANDLATCLAEGLELKECLQMDLEDQTSTAMQCCGLLNYDFCKDLTPRREQCAGVAEEMELCLADGLTWFECRGGLDEPFSWALNQCCQYDYDYCSEQL